MTITITLAADTAALVAEHVADPESVCRQALADAIERAVATSGAEAENSARRQAVEAVAAPLAKLRPTPEGPPTDGGDGR